VVNKVVFFSLICFSFVSCSKTNDKSGSSKETGLPQRVKSSSQGIASWYSIRTNGGTRTASGEKLRDSASTAAHKSLKMGTRVRVTNLRNSKSEIVRITDRGPYVRGRIIDVTVGVAKRLGFYARGLAPVRVEVLEGQE